MILIERCPFTLSIKFQLFALSASPTSSSSHVFILPYLAHSHCLLYSGYPDSFLFLESLKSFPLQRLCTCCFHCFKCFFSRNSHNCLNFDLSSLSLNIKVFSAQKSALCILANINLCIRMHTLLVNFFLIM